MEQASAVCPLAVATMKMKQTARLLTSLSLRGIISTGGTSSQAVRQFALRTRYNMRVSPIRVHWPISYIHAPQPAMLSAGDVAYTPAW